MYYRELFTVRGEAGGADDPVAGRYLFLFTFQITDVEMEVSCLIDDVGVLVLCRADVYERTVPVLKSKPLEFGVFFLIE